MCLVDISVIVLVYGVVGSFVDVRGLCRSKLKDCSENVMCMFDMLDPVSDFYDCVSAFGAVSFGIVIASLHCCGTVWKYTLFPRVCWHQSPVKM